MVFGVRLSSPDQACVLGINRLELSAGIWQERKLKVHYKLIVTKVVFFFHLSMFLTTLSTMRPLNIYAWQHGTANHTCMQVPYHRIMQTNVRFTSRVQDAADVTHLSYWSTVQCEWVKAKNKNGSFSLYNLYDTGSPFIATMAQNWTSLALFWMILATEYYIIKPESPVKNWTPGNT